MFPVFLAWVLIGIVQTIWKWKDFTKGCDVVVEIEPSFPRKWVIAVSLFYCAIYGPFTYRMLKED